MVSFDPLRFSVARVVVEPLSLDRLDLSSAMIESARAFPFLIVIVLAEFGGSCVFAGSMFSFDGALGNGLFALVVCLEGAEVVDVFFSSVAACDLFVIDFLPAVAADAVERIELAEGDFRRDGALLAGVRVDEVVDAEVLGDTFRAAAAARDAAVAEANEPTVVSDARRGRLFGSVGTGGLGDLEFVAVLRTEVVDVVDTVLDRGTADSRDVFGMDSRVDTELLVLETDAFEREDVGRAG